MRRLSECGHILHRGLVEELLKKSNTMEKRSTNFPKRLIERRRSRPSLKSIRHHRYDLSARYAVDGLMLGTLCS